MGQIHRDDHHRRPSDDSSDESHDLDQSTNYPELEFAPSFRAFAKQRAELLAFLRPLPKAAWSRSAMVTGAGRPRDRTVLEYARWLANHERTHVKQIARIVSG